MKVLITSLLLILCLTSASAQFKTMYPEIPRIDVHAHFGNDSTGIANCLDLREILLDRSGIDLAMWINLGGAKDPVENTSRVWEASKGRMLCAIADYSAHDGLRYAPGELEAKQKQGFPDFGNGRYCERGLFWRT